MGCIQENKDRNTVRRAGQQHGYLVADGCIQENKDRNIDLLAAAMTRLADGLHPGEQGSKPYQEWMGADGIFADGLHPGEQGSKPDIDVIAQGVRFGRWAASRRTRIETPSKERLGTTPDYTRTEMFLGVAGVV